MPATPAQRQPATTAGEAATLARDTARACTLIARHLDTLWQLAYEQHSATERVGGRSSEHRDLSGVGDRRIRDTLRTLTVAQLNVLTAVDMLMNTLNAGPGADTNLRGSLISKAEMSRVLAAKNRRTARGESTTALMPQPRRPGKGNR